MEFKIYSFYFPFSAWSIRKTNSSRFHFIFLFKVCYVRKTLIFFGCLIYGLKEQRQMIYFFGAYIYFCLLPFLWNNTDLNCMLHVQYFIIKIVQIVWQLNSLCIFLIDFCFGSLEKAFLIAFPVNVYFRSLLLPRAITRLNMVTLLHYFLL